ncbi:MAG: DEAD/DEAH box helicase [Desulfobacterales bacterium]|nr:DEAD/DEAH box helicase [Desulfobacterales bacterium]
MPELKRELTIAVRTLVEIVSRSGDLRNDFFGAIRSVEAIRAHQKVQRSRPETYTAEEAVSHRVETDRFLLKIGGRIDGVFRLPDQVIIDEIKTTTRPLADFEKKENPVHWSQAKAYAFIFAAEHDLETIDVQLTYYRIDTGETREFRKSFPLEELRAFFEDLTARWLRWAETIADWSDLRDVSIEALAFPFDRFREGQRPMAVAVYRTVVNDGQLIVQAATGIGKTMAAVFPAVKAMVKKEQPKIFYLTARTTGRSVAERALDELRRVGLRLKSLTLTAKDKICFNPEGTCAPDECPFAKGYYDRVGKALEEMFREDVFTREAVEAMARKHEVCPFEFSLDLSLWVDCIICDYNYAFDPRVYLRRFFVEGEGDYTFLVDEAHNLVDRSREMFSASIQKKAVLETRRAVREALPKAHQWLSKINTWLLKAGKAFEDKEPWRWEAEPPDDLYPHVRGFLRTAERWLARNIKTPFRETLLDLYFTLNRFMKVAEQYDETYATCYERDGKDLMVKLFCIDPSNQMEDALKRCGAAVFFSATLTPAV